MKYDLNAPAPTPPPDRVQTVPLDSQAMVKLMADLYDRKSSELFVIMDAAKTTVVKDPGLGRPWCSPNHRIAESHARTITKETGRPTIVTTLQDAITTLAKRVPAAG